MANLRRRWVSSMPPVLMSYLCATPILTCGVVRARSVGIFESYGGFEKKPGDATKAELEAACIANGLPKSGNAVDLMIRLAMRKVPRREPLQRVADGLELAHHRSAVYSSAPGGFTRSDHCAQRADAMSVSARIFLGKVTRPLPTCIDTLPPW